MSMRKTLGGDRLGSGKRMQVEMHGFERSTHDLGYVWRSSMSAGTLVPFMNDIALPGDTWDINLDAYANTHPAVGPLFGSFKMQLDVFLAPLRLYNSWLHNNALNIGRNMSQIKLPQIPLVAFPIAGESLATIDIDNAQVNPSCILAYLGIRGIGLNMGEDNMTRFFHATPILVYWEIYKNYYANKQEVNGWVVHTEGEALIETVDEVRLITAAINTLVPVDPAVARIPVGLSTTIRITFTGTQPLPKQIFLQTERAGFISSEELGLTWMLVSAGVLEANWNFATFNTDYVINWRYQTATDGYNGTIGIVEFPLDDVDKMRNKILATPGNTVLALDATDGLLPYIYLYQLPGGFPNIVNSQEGLGIKTYQSDLFNNWLNTEWIDGAGGVTEVTAIDTSGGSFTLDTLNLSKKVYYMLNRIMVSGGSYNDWQDAVWSHDRHRQIESPMYMGGLSKELVFEEVVSNAEATSDTGDQPLGTLAGKGKLASKHKGGSITIKVDEPSIIMGIVSLTPRVDYSQGNIWHTHLETMDDLHKPQLDEIGFQELITEQMAWFGTMRDVLSNQWLQMSAGKQPAWTNYMTNVNRTYGSFAIKTNEMFMTLNRRYEVSASTGIGDVTTYIDPTKYNFIFANTALDSQNFWVQLGVDQIVRRKMSAKVMPNL